jgi:hypothetical protein
MKNSWGNHLSENLQGFQKNAITILLEDETDFSFWSSIFSRYKPKNTKLVTDYGGKSRGKQHLINTHLHKLDKNLVLCIDSDYDYLQNNSMFYNDFLFHTYTYAVENHKLCPTNLNNLCAEFLGFEVSQYLDFEVFIAQFSEISYDLLRYHLYFLLTKNTNFQITEAKLSEYFSIPETENETYLQNNGQYYLDEITKKVRKIVKILDSKAQNIDFQEVDTIFEKHQITKRNCYLFLMGHPIYDNIERLLKNVVKIYARNNHNKLLQDKQQKEHYSNITGIFKYVEREKKGKNKATEKIEIIEIKVEDRLAENHQRCLSYTNCVLFDKIEHDVKLFFEKF